MGLLNRGKSNIKSKSVSIKPAINQETILKLKLYNKNITVSIYDKDNQSIK